MKDFLGGLFALMSLTAFILLIIGFFKPGAALFWYKKPRTKKASLTINGLITVLSFVLAGVLLPAPPADKDTAKAEASQQPAAEIQPAPTASPDPTPAGPAVAYNVAKVEKKNGDMYCKVTIDNMPASDALIEKTRQLKAQYQAKGKFVCSFYYKKYTEYTTAVASVGYLEDCSHCEYKDKDGAPVDLPFYNANALLTDSLRSLRFDTAGYRQEAAFLSLGGVNTRNIILSSDGKDALEIFQSTTGYTTYALIKRTVDGQERFYDDGDRTSYYVINRKDGFIDFYEDGQLNSQHVIEN